MTAFLNGIKAALDYLGGVTETPATPPPGWMQSPLFWGIWWALLMLLTLCFSGQTSKFIYIDF